MRASLSRIALVSIAALGCNAQVHLPDASADAAAQPDWSATVIEVSGRKNRT